MACNIDPNDWTAIPLATGKLVLEDGNYRLLIEDEEGIPEIFVPLVIGMDVPLAIRFNESNVFEFVLGGNWPEECSEITEIGPLSLPAGGFAFDGKGQGLGYLSNDSDLDFFSINLSDFPLVFEFSDGGLMLKLQSNDPSHFFSVNI